MDGTFRGAVSPETIVQMFGAPNWPRWYVLTPYESPNNVMAQQVRAINLIHSLLASGVVSEGTRIGIVGAGSAGVTAAAYAVARGVPVTIIEKQGQALSLFATSDRFLHPRLFDWPDPDWHHREAELPVMSWAAGPARRVAAELRRQWLGWRKIYSFQPANGNPNDPPFLEFETDAIHLLSTPSTGSQWPTAIELCWQTRLGGKCRRRSVTAVIVAVGVGAELQPTDPGLADAWLPYWKTRESELRKLPGRIFVSGNGDGAIADMAHCVFEGFSYETLAEVLQQCACRQILEEEVLKIEAQAACVPDEQRSDRLTTAYAELELKLDLSPIIKVLRVRSDVQRVLVAGRSKKALFDGAYPINRLLLSILLKDERKTCYVCQRASWREKERVRVSSATDDVNEEFDHAIVRHGISRTLEQEFPDLSRAVATRLKTWGELRLTRRPLWSSPTALAVSQQRLDVVTHSERPKLSSCYSDILDPWVQSEFRRLIPDDAEFKAFYTGRIRLLSLLHNEIIVNAAQFVDGSFFHLLLKEGESRLKELTDECHLRFIVRSLPSLLKFSKSDRAIRGWPKKWLREPWERRNGLAKPYYFFSLGSQLGMKLFVVLTDQNASGKRVSDAVANAERHLRELGASKRQEDVFAQIKRAAYWLKEHGQESSDANAPFRIRDFYDPGWFHSQLGRRGQTYLGDNAPELIPARRPRQATIVAMARAKLPNRERAKLEEWLYYAYHGEISRLEKAGAWETVCILGCEWSRWSGRGDVNPRGISITALGHMPQNTWSDLARRCRESVRDWYLGQTNNLDALLNELASECAPWTNRRASASKRRDPHRWRRRIERWSRGDYSIELRPLPIRSKTDEQSPVFIIMERDSEGPLAVTQFRSQ